MRSISMIRFIALVCLMLSGAFVPPVQAETDGEALERASALFNKGDAVQALGLVEGILAHAPQDQTGLYYSALINFHMGNTEAARGRLERAVRLSGNYFAAWELMIQVTQEQGDLARRNEAVARLKISASTAIDPIIRAKSDFIRERIRVGDNAVTAIEYYRRGGSEFTRFLFGLGDPRQDPDHGLLLRTDQRTTDNWRATALLVPDKQLFHLDLVYPKPEGGNAIAIYKYYVGEPDYDTVRADVLKILRDEMKPLSGTPGTLAGILKR